MLGQLGLVLSVWFRLGQMSDYVRLGLVKSG